MLHYDPLRSTTNDVVHQAIIPQSRQGIKGAAYADSISTSGGSRQWPEKIVTHAWSGLFVSLVAAVAADAMELHAYGTIEGDLVRGDVGLVRAKLACHEGALQRPYWICAFCINQHASICAGVAPPGDSTGSAGP